jgi:hypothetical protein
MNTPTTPRETVGEDEALIDAMKQLSQRHSLSKLSLLLKLIDRAYRAVGQFPPVGQAHVEELELWADVLEGVPEMLLADYFRQAERTRRNGFRVAPLDVLAAYNADQAGTTDDAEERKLAGWRALADSDDVGTVRQMTPCEYQGCETECYSRYCMKHGDLRLDRRLGVLRPKFEASDISPGATK